MDFIADNYVPVIDGFPIGLTDNMRIWYTSKPNHPTLKSQISHVVFDSSWEAAEAYHFEHSGLVHAYAKNDHLGFYVLYLYNGVVGKFFPDYLIRLQNGKTLILEVKGQDSEQNRVKRQHLDQWVQAVNQHDFSRLIEGITGCAGSQTPAWAPAM